MKDKTQKMIVFESDTVNKYYFIEYSANGLN